MGSASVCGNRSVKDEEERPEQQLEAVTMRQVDSLRRGLLHVAGCHASGVGCGSHTCRSTRRLLYAVRNHHCSTDRVRDCRACALWRSVCNAMPHTTVTMPTTTTM